MSPCKWVDNASDAAFSVDSEMTVTGWNAEAESLLGYPAGEAIGMKCGRVLRAVFADGAPLCSPLCEGGACLSRGTKWGVGKTRLRRRDGEFVVAELSSLVLPQSVRRDDPDQPVAIVFMRAAGVEQDQTAQEWRMRAFTLGRFALTGPVGDLEPGRWKRKQSALVLKCLLSHLDRPVHRERLIEWLWPETDVEIGWRRLKVALSSLRGELRDGGVSPEIVETVGESYLIRSTAIWLDAHQFAGAVSDARQHLKAGDDARALARFEDARHLYHGDFFADEPFAEWCAGEREHLSELHLDMLAGLGGLYIDAERFDEAATVCREALNTDPCREQFMRMLIESLTGLERPDWAHMRFIDWHRQLETDYDISPTRETMEAFHRLMSGRRPFSKAV